MFRTPRPRDGAAGCVAECAQRYDVRQLQEQGDGIGEVDWQQRDRRLPFPMPAIAAAPAAGGSRRQAGC